MYRNLATVGITTISFSHEIINPLISMDSKLTNLISDLHQKYLTDVERRQKILFLTNSVESMLNWANYIRAFTALIAGKGKMRKYHEINVSQTINEIISAYSSIFRDNEISTSIDIPGRIPILYMDKADYESIIINLITNSVKALKQVSRNRKMKFQADISHSNFVFSLSDNGIGVSRGDEERIFAPLYTIRVIFYNVKS